MRFSDDEIIHLVDPPGTFNRSQLIKAFRVGFEQGSNRWIPVRSEADLPETPTYYPLVPNGQASEWYAVLVHKMASWYKMRFIRSGYDDFEEHYWEGIAGMRFEPLDVIAYKPITLFKEQS